MKVQSTVLPNKLRVVLADTGGAESATVLLLVKAGSRYETSSNNGIAHFFEHMAFKGSAKYPDSFTISSTIEGMGGVFNAFTSKDHTGYWIKGTVDKVGLMLDVLADMVTSSKLESAEIEKEKGVIVEEINMYEDMPQHKVSNVYDALLYPNHPLGMDIAGKPETVKAFNRDHFVDYIQSLYHPDNAVLVISGGIQSSMQGIQQNVTDTFGKWEEGQSISKRYRYDRYAPHEIASSPRISTLLEMTQSVAPRNDGELTYSLNKRLSAFTKQTEQAHFILGYTMDYGFMDERKYRLGILSAILGGGMSSRLFMEIREKRGLCYYVHTSRDMYEETGSLVTSAGVRCNIDTVNEALKLIVAEHHAVAQTQAEGIDKLATEVARVKSMLKGRFLLSLEDSQSVASLYGGKLLLEGQIVTPDEIIQKIESVRVEDVIAEAQAVVSNDRLRVAIVGPFTQDQIKI